MRSGVGAERQSMRKIRCSHLSADQIPMNATGDGNSWLEGPEATRVRRLAEMNENEREDAIRRAIQQGLLTGVEAERMRELSVQWNAQQTQDRRARLPAKLAAPKSSISIAGWCGTPRRPVRP